MPLRSGCDRAQSRSRIASGPANSEARASSERAPCGAARGDRACRGTSGRSGPSPCSDWFERYAPYIAHTRRRRTRAGAVMELAASRQVHLLAALAVRRQWPEATLTSGERARREPFQAGAVGRSVCPYPSAPKPAAREPSRAIGYGTSASTSSHYTGPIVVAAHPCAGAKSASAAAR